MPVTDSSIIIDELALHGGSGQQKTVRCFGCFRAGICLLLVELCEKLTFFEVVCNMIPFCTVKLGYCNHQAAILNLCFIGVSAFTPVLVGWLADNYFGRGKLVYMSLVLHFLGTALLSVLAFPLEDLYGDSYPMVNNAPVEERASLFHTALLTLCLGTGGIRAVVCPLDVYGLQEEESKKPMSFFNWASWSMNLKAAAVFLGVSCIQHLGASTIVVLLPSLSLVTALVALYMRHCDLIYQPEKHCSFLMVAGVLLKTLKKRCLPYCHLGRDGANWSARAVETHDGLQEEDAELVFSTLLPLLGFQLPYRMCLAQIPSGYYLQTMNSNRTLGGFPLPIALMNALSILPLLILVPLMDFFSHRLLPSKRDGPFLSACIIAGNGCAALSVAIAGFLEIHRKLTPEQASSGKASSVSSLACGSLVPQYVLLGVSEALANPAVSAVIHRFIPSIFRGTPTNVLSLFHGFACFSGALLVELVYLISKAGFLSFFRYCNLNHFNAQSVSGGNREETLLWEKSLKFYGSTQETSSSIDLWETAL
ncbi:Slc15a5 [Phodopus roborovskii]|uniref:Slc15a5 protein n=1 Tax=Phodopus roborovskii TaxID=109678 RepID=A0AAV0ADE2_PHORO|nr:Slc15a5 [Phodopus roborovskii]